MEGRLGPGHGEGEARYDMVPQTAWLMNRNYLSQLWKLQVRDEGSSTDGLCGGPPSWL